MSENKIAQLNTFMTKYGLFLLKTPTIAFILINIVRVCYFNGYY